MFYNPIFTDFYFKVIHINKVCENQQVYTYGQILYEVQKQRNGFPHNRKITGIFNNIKHINAQGRTQHTMYNSESQKSIPFNQVTHKEVYYELIRRKYKTHHSQEKWEQRLNNTSITWSHVWQSINNPLSTEKTKTIIWEQIHLNDYNTYSYNKWHNSQQPCPLCLQIPKDKFHITLDCNLVSVLWNDLSHHLQKIHPAPVSKHEKVFGLSGNTPNVILRNWLTFVLRQCIVEHESIAFHNKKGQGNEILIKNSYNQMIKSEV